MSRIFRSDTVAPGERVVVRRYLPGAARHTDVIGHVIEATGEELVLRPQEVGGYPTSLPEVRIPQSEIRIVKKLSPRRILNSDIRHIETAYSHAFPGIEHTWSADGQWLLRAGDGITERSNSAAPLGRSALFTPVPLEEITQFYRRHNLPPKILIPERIGKQAETLVESQGWTLGPEIIVMTKDLTEDIAPPPSGEFMFTITDQPDDAWLKLYHFRGQALPPEALALLRKEIDGTMGFGAMRTPAGETVGITRGTITSSGPHTYLGYSAVEVAEAFRRRGIGTQLGEHMLTWGKQQGADTAYLQVIASNNAGIGLYEKLGFSEHHRHRYATIS